MRRQMLELHESMRKLNHHFPSKWSLFARGYLMVDHARLHIHKGPVSGSIYFNAKTERAALDKACKELEI